MRVCARGALMTAWVAVGAALAMGLGPASTARPASRHLGDQGESWAQIAKLPDWQGIWNPDFGYFLKRNPKLRHDRKRLAGMFRPHDLTPKAQAHYAAYLAKQKRGEDLAPQTANCLPPGMPQIMNQPYPVEFLFTPGKVVILIEAYEQERTIYTDGRTHPPLATLTPSFQGYSTGRWDGKTLVVNTVGVLPSTGPGPHTGAGIAPGVPHDQYMRIIERIRKVDANHILITRTIIDPPVLAKPWTTTFAYKKEKGDLLEYICEEGNRDSASSTGVPGERIGGP